MLLLLGAYDRGVANDSIAIRCRDVSMSAAGTTGYWLEVLLPSTLLTMYT